MIRRALMGLFFLLGFVAGGSYAAGEGKSVLREIERGFIWVAENVKPTVVSIRAESPPRSRRKRSGKKKDKRQLIMQINI